MRLLAFKVDPDSTKSTIRLHKPIEGANSMAPFSLIHSACTPLDSKWFLVIFGYLVATLTWLHVLGSSLTAMSF